jgi:hypothetical protein
MRMIDIPQKAKEEVEEQVALIRILIANPKFWIILSRDVFLICLSFYFSHLIRFEFILTDAQLIKINVLHYHCLNSSGDAKNATKPLNRTDYTRKLAG